eukprot:jgi/Mesvir1/19906/Mv13180-RA.3
MSENLSVEECPCPVCGEMFSKESIERHADDHFTSPRVEDNQAVPRGALKERKQEHARDGSCGARAGMDDNDGARTSEDDKHGPWSGDDNDGGGSLVVISREEWDQLRSSAEPRASSAPSSTPNDIGHTEWDSLPSRPANTSATRAGNGSRGPAATGASGAASMCTGAGAAAAVAGARNVGATAATSSSSSAAAARAAVAAAAAATAMAATAATAVDSAVARLLRTQRPEPLVALEREIMPMLRGCLQAEADKFVGSATTLLSGAVYNFHSQHDAGWGCGWRNLQTLCFHLLERGPPFASTLFGGCGFVPDVSSLQRWLELAWADGFDTMGAAQLGGKVHGTRTWIGATDCVALLHSQGARTQLMDFKLKANQGAGSRARGRGGAQQPALQRGYHAQLVAWVWDYFRGGDGAQPSTQRQQGTGHGRGDDAPTLAGGRGGGRGKRQREMGEGGGGGGIPGGCAPGGGGSGRSNGAPATLWGVGSGLEEDEHLPLVVETSRPPLFFQHAGHSRTIIGIQRRRPPRGTRWEHLLLVLDPSQPRQQVLSALASRAGWQGLLKRGATTITQPEYQLVAVKGDVVPPGPSRDPLKFLTSTVVLS